MPLTDQELLDKTREAIDAITTGRVQSYSLNGRNFTKLSIKQLWDQEALLRNRINRSTKGSFGLGVIGGVS